MIWLQLLCMVYRRSPNNSWNRSNLTKKNTEGILCQLVIVSLPLMYLYGTSILALFNFLWLILPSLHCEVAEHIIFTYSLGQFIGVFFLGVKRDIFIILQIARIVRYLSMSNCEIYIWQYDQPIHLLISTFHNN